MNENVTRYIMMKCAKDNPAIPLASVEEIIYLQQPNRGEDLLSLCEQIVKLFPNDSAALFFQGTALGRLQRFAEATCIIESAINHYTEDPDLKPSMLHYTLGFSLYYQGDFEKAIKHLNICISFNDDLPEHSDAWYMKALALNSLKRNTEALETVSESIRHFPDKADSRSLLGDILVDMNENNKALDAFNEAIVLKPDDAAYYNNKGFVLNDLSRFEEARHALTTAIELDPSAAPYCHRGYANFKLGHYQEALADYDRALELDPDYQRAINRKEELVQTMKGQL
jgi:tetratricopeptide (TPR) repeat protein